MDDIKFIVLLQPGDIRWTVVSSDIANSDENRENLVFCDFLPATWYQLKVSAINDAGKTMALYDFATTKINGGKLTKGIGNAESFELIRMVRIDIAFNLLVSQNVFQHQMYFPATIYQII